MNTIKRDKAICWVLTIFILAPTAGSGFPELFTKGSESVIQTMQTLGYPLYLLKILGLAKILGAIAILTGRFPKLKEWAYAGFAFDFLGAATSHVLAGDQGNAPLPLILFALLMVSYYFSNKISTQENLNQLTKREEF